MTNCIYSSCQKLIYAIACVATLSLGACGASVGTVVTNDQLKDFKVGTTTYEQVVAKLGKPNAITTSDDGGIVASYTGGNYHVKPETYIPIAGAFVGGTESTAHTVIFDFDKNDILTHIKQADSAVGARMG